MRKGKKAADGDWRRVVEVVKDRLGNSRIIRQRNESVSMKSSYERFDIVDAVFRPIRIDDLKPGVSDFIGHRGKWQASWMIDEEDGGNYVGQWAMTPYDFHAVFVWVPECDLELIGE